jgi:acetyl-CoA acyltransferase
MTIARTRRWNAGSAEGRDRIALVAGLRTPFVRQGTAFKHLSALDLGSLVVRELVARADVDPRAISLLVYGQAVPSPRVPNIAREIVLSANLPERMDAFTVVRACASSLQATASAAEAILTGAHDLAIVGGVDSASDVPVTVSRALATALVDASRARSLADKARSFAHLSARDLLPVPPALREASTGLTMGEHAERMAKDMGISRKAQDELAHRSHVRAAAAWERGVFDDEVMRVVGPPAEDRPTVEDNVVRKRSDLEAYAKLTPVFDPAHGTVTAATSSALTDGASALLLASEAKVEELGLRPLAWIRSWGFAALSPAEGLLMGPAYATPLALDRARITLADLDLVEMHEAFAAQVLCNMQAFSSRRFAEEKLGRASRIGEIDEARLNVNGGSIALGHPFGATGARLLLGLARELRRRGGKLGLATACAAGGLGGSVVLEAA